MQGQVLTFEQKKALDEDRLSDPVVFISSEKELSVKIPATRRGEAALLVERYVTFKDHKCATNSKYIASYLRRLSVSPGFCEFKK
jgi:hypothetical protein